MVALPKMENNHGNKVRKLLQAGLPEGHETETSRNWRRMSQTARNTGENEKTPRGILSAFFG
jgi:hypothetical protein